LVVGSKTSTRRLGCAVLMSPKTPVMPPMKWMRPFAVAPNASKRSTGNAVDVVHAPGPLAGGGAGGVSSVVEEHAEPRAARERRSQRAGRIEDFDTTDGTAPQAR
jgi:hypothetical protein